MFSLRLIRVKVRGHDLSGKMKANREKTHTWGTHSEGERKRVLEAQTFGKYFLSLKDSHKVETSPQISIPTSVLSSSYCGLNSFEVL